MRHATGTRFTAVVEKESQDTYSGVPDSTRLRLVEGGGTQKGVEGLEDALLEWPEQLGL